MLRSGLLAVLVVAVAWPAAAAGPRNHLTAADRPYLRLHAGDPREPFPCAWKRLPSQRGAWGVPGGTPRFLRVRGRPATPGGHRQ